MENKEQILQLVEQYRERFLDEVEEIKPLFNFVTGHEGNQLFYRKNFSGHITTSAFIVNKDSSKLLLLKHKSLNRWLQPGGHVDEVDSSLINAALREAVEETGLQAENLQPVSTEIFDIDSHQIPANERKLEPPHVHHDIRFLFRCTDENALNISLEESTDSKWVPFSELINNADFNWVEEKIKTAI